MLILNDNIIEAPEQNAFGLFDCRVTNSRLIFRVSLTLRRSPPYIMVGGWEPVYNLYIKTPESYWKAVEHSTDDM